MMTSVKRSFILGLVYLATTLNVPLSTAKAIDDNALDRESLKVRDRIVLRSGQVLSGAILSDDEDDKRPVLFRGDDGLELAVDRKLISKIEPADELAERYNQFIDNLQDDAASHREVAHWCEEQPSGRQRFKQQIIFHNKRIVQLDPNDKKARRELGYTYLRDENRWVLEGQFWDSQGYVRQGAGWAPKLLDEIDQQTDQQNDVLAVSKKKFRVWKKNLKRMSASDAVDSLLQIADRNLIPEIYEQYQNEKSLDIKSVYLEVFASVRPVQRLQVRALADAVVNLGSDKALDYLAQEDINPRMVAEELTLFLKDKQNAKIRRAAYALGELESRHSILALANVLRTKHLISAGTPGRQAATFSNQGGVNQFGSEGPKSATVNNEPVLRALEKITGQDLGYSKDAYQKWYVNNFTDSSMKARR